MLKKKFIILFIFSIFISAESFSQISFIAVGDWGREGNKYQSGVAAQMSEWAAGNNANFVISLGDNFYENGVRSVDDPLWQKSFENVYTAPSLQIPWYVALGNHDYHGLPQVEVDYSKTSTRWKMPSRYFSFTQTLDDGSKALFIILDTSPLCTSDGESRDQFSEDITKINPKIQINWLDSILANTEAKWRIVCGHHPVISGGYHGGVDEIQELIDPLLIKYNVDVYLCGHDHDLQHLVKGKINYFVSGAGSKPRECENTEYTKFYASATSGFLGVNLSSSSFDASFTDIKGKQIYSVTISK